MTVHLLLRCEVNYSTTIKIPNERISFGYQLYISIITDTNQYEKIYRMVLTILPRSRIKTIAHNIFVLVCSEPKGPSGPIASPYFPISFFHSLTVQSDRQVHVQQFFILF